MIIKSLEIFSQNVQKNKLLTNSILKNNKNYNIILIQEPPWSNIWQISSTLSQEGDNLIGAPYYPSWTLFVRNSDTENDYPRVAIYVNTRLSKLQFFIQKDIFNHWDINLISFFNHSSMHFLLNVYSNSQQSALKHLKDTEVNLNNVIIITGDFNICDSDWDPSYSHYSIHADTLHKISDSLSLELSIPINSVPI